ncbi:hypothetical protein N1851_023022 [Merluccius polli]|uniref:Uncharacterized protein n=1 Tax=Merluccius polli TaxID=89951 RepID=A0AA47NX14_MERPO|nr:hypothetical protein N1851_023022 [Merluccius polli]
MSHILLIGTPSKSLQKLLHIQNSAARVLMRPSSPGHKPHILVTSRRDSGKERFYLEPWNFGRTATVRLNSSATRRHNRRNVLIFLCGAAPRPALGRLGRVRGLPGAADVVSRCAFLPPHGGWGRGPLAPGVTVDRDGLSSVRPNRVASFRAGIRLTYNWRKGAAAMSATHPTRLETRTKESNARASQRVLRNPAAQ